MSSAAPRLSIAGALGAGLIVAFATAFSGALLTFLSMIGLAIGAHRPSESSLPAAALITVASIPYSLFFLLPAGLVIGPLQNHVLGVRRRDLFCSALLGALLGAAILIGVGVGSGAEGIEIASLALGAGYGALACASFWWLKRAILSDGNERQDG